MLNTEFATPRKGQAGARFESTSLLAGLNLRLSEGAFGLAPVSRDGYANLLNKI